MVMVLIEGQDVLILYMGVWYRWPCSTGDIATTVNSSLCEYVIKRHTAERGPLQDKFLYSVLLVVLSLVPCTVNLIHLFGNLPSIVIVHHLHCTLPKEGKYK